ncbi:hypothetical protein SLE2022_021290 [Rubroshorea leprosula]
MPDPLPTRSDHSNYAAAICWNCFSQNFLTCWWKQWCGTLSSANVSPFPWKKPCHIHAASFESPSEHVRNFSHRRNESNSNNADKKQYELDIDRIIHEEDSN